MFVSGNRQDVAALLAEGKTPREIAGLLGVARNAVYYHVRRLREQAGSEDDEPMAAAIPPRARWSVATREEVGRPLAEGFTRAQIASRL